MCIKCPIHSCKDLVENKTFFTLVEGVEVIFLIFNVKIEETLTNTYYMQKYCVQSNKVVITEPWISDSKWQ